MRPLPLLLLSAPIFLLSLAQSSPSTAPSPAHSLLYPSPFPSNITDSYRANWTSLSTTHFSGGETGIIRFDLADLTDSGYTLRDSLGARKSSTGSKSTPDSDDAVRIVSGSWDVMIDVQSFGSKTVSQIIATFKVFGVYNTATGRLVLQNVHEASLSHRNHVTAYSGSRRPAPSPPAAHSPSSSLAPRNANSQFNSFFKCIDVPQCLCELIHPPPSCPLAFPPLLVLLSPLAQFLLLLR